MTEERPIFEDLVLLVRGHPMPNTHFFTAKNMEDTMDYVPKDGDVVIGSFPKTGTNWLQYIVLQIISKAEFFPSFDDTIKKVVPFMEAAGIAAVEAQQGKPRIYKHHLAYNLVQKNSRAKYIYIYRHPEDTFVSYYHFIMGLRCKPLSQRAFDELFDHLLAGNVGYGNYFDHVLSFYEHREDDGLLMVSYEKMYSNRKEEILRIAKFLGEEYYQCLKEDEEIFNKIIEHTTFDYMKKNLTMTHPKVLEEASKIKAPSDVPKVNFFRKGIVGDGKSVLSEDQREKLRKGAEKVLNGTSIINEWYSQKS